MAKDEGQERAQESTCCGVVEEAATRSRERREKRRQKPMPWILLKLSIAVTLGLIGYASYVYIGRLCVPMIKRKSEVLGGRATGIGFLVVFCILDLMVLWSYVKIVLTSPGLARKYAKKSPPPVISNALPTWWDSDRELGGVPYQYVPHTGNESVQSVGTVPRPSSDAAGHNYDTNAGMTDAIPALAEVRVGRPDDSASPLPSHPNGAAPSQQLPMMYTRKPSATPVMNPENRYCHKDEFVKPPRTHHCRACGTCVLRYDHHCPWIGQCVGARNHKFFVIFDEWVVLFCIWTFSTLIADTIRSGIRGDGVDAQKIVVIVFAALFGVFTVALLGSHVRLIMHNLTTVESLSVQRMKDREKRVLARLHAWYEFGAKRRTLKQWDSEWGRIGKEGNLWWLGSYRANWESVMGHHIWEWFLPIGRGPLDGLSYPKNPRFDSEGRWRPRREWPKDLQ